MRIFKRISNLEDNLAKALLEISELKAKTKQLESKLPDFDEAVAKGVDELWNQAVRSVIDYNPFAKSNDDGESR